MFCEINVIYHCLKQTHRNGMEHMEYNKDEEMIVLIDMMCSNTNWD